MCLSSIDSIGIKPVKEGWKVFGRTYIEDGCRFFSPMFYGKEIEENKWQTVRSWLDKLFRRNYLHHIWTGGYSRSHMDKLLGRNRLQYYESGFHVFHHKDDAVKEYLHAQGRVLRKVLVKDPICVGYQHGCLVTVARKMKVLTEEESK